MHSMLQFIWNHWLLFQHHLNENHVSRHSLNPWGIWKKKLQIMEHTKNTFYIWYESGFNEEKNCSHAYTYAYVLMSKWHFSHKPKQKYSIILMHWEVTTKIIMLSYMNLPLPSYHYHLLFQLFLGSFTKENLLLPS